MNYCYVIDLSRELFFSIGIENRTSDTQTNLKFNVKLVSKGMAFFFNINKILIVFEPQCLNNFNLEYTFSHFLSLELEAWLARSNMGKYIGR